MDRAIQRARDRADPATGIDVARRLLELEPLHEEAHRALMWFLATGGQRGAALAQFETCRYVLREEVGVEPSPATLALRDEVALAGGFAGLDQPRAGGGRPAAEPDGGMPRPLGALLGRGPELARLHELLDDPACRLVTLVGPGGIGKTRLAVEIAATRRGRHHDGGVFVSFVGTVPGRPEEAADLMIAKLAGALGVSLAVPRDPLELLADHLAGSQLLLVLDNLEQLRDAVEVLAEVLRRGPGVQVLATSRRRLGLGAEWLVEVPGLPYPPEGDPDPDRHEAVQLFQERARLVRPGFREGADRREVARLPPAGRRAARRRAGRALGALGDARGDRRPARRRPGSVKHHRARRRAAPPEPALGDRLVLAAAHRGRTAGAGPPVGAAGRLRPGGGRRRGRREPAPAGRAGRPLAGRGR